MGAQVASGATFDRPMSIYTAEQGSDLFSY